jgi:hypothetical protein
MKDGMDIKENPDGQIPADLEMPLMQKIFILML